MKLDTITDEQKEEVLAAVKANLRGDETLIGIKLVDVDTRAGYWEKGFVVAWKSESRVGLYKCGTHTVKINSEGRSMLVWGHYDLTDAQALEDLNKRR